MDDFNEEKEHVVFSKGIIIMCAIVIIWSVLVTHALCITSRLHPLHEPSSSSRSSTAFRVRLHPAAITYLNSIASDLLAEQLPRIVIPNIHHRLANDQGQILLRRVHVSRFRRARIHNISVSEPNKITWTMHGLNMWQALLHFSSLLLCMKLITL